MTTKTTPAGVREIRIAPAEAYRLAEAMTAEECHRWILATMRACMTGEAEPGTYAARLLDAATARRDRRAEAGRRSGEARRARRATTAPPEPPTAPADQSPPPPSMDAATGQPDAPAEPPTATEPPTTPPIPATSQPETPTAPPETAASASRTVPPTPTAPTPTDADTATPEAKTEPDTAAPLPDTPPPTGNQTPENGDSLVARFRRDPEGTARTCPDNSLPALAELWEETWTDAPGFYGACVAILRTIPPERFRETLVARIAEGWHGPDGGATLLRRLETQAERWRRFGF